MFVFNHTLSCRVQVRSPWRQALPSEPRGLGGGLQSALDRFSSFLSQLFNLYATQGSVSATPTACFGPITTVLV